MDNEYRNISKLTSALAKLMSFVSFSVDFTNFSTDKNYDADLSGLFPIHM